jgi:hypothetical protein
MMKFDSLSPTDAWARAEPASAVDRSLEADASHAESLLYELAVTLRRVPVEESTRRMHVRALDLKRQVVRWRADQPPRDERLSALDEIDQLAQEAAFWQQKSLGRSRAVATDS